MNQNWLNLNQILVDGKHDFLIPIKTDEEIRSAYFQRYRYLANS